MQISNLSNNNEILLKPTMRGRQPRHRQQLPTARTNLNHTRMKYYTCGENISMTSLATSGKRQQATRKRQKARGNIRAKFKSNIQFLARPKTRKKAIIAKH